MSATPNRELQRLHRVGYGFIGTGTFMLLSWLNPVDLPQGSTVAALVVGIVVILGLYRRHRPDSRSPQPKRHQP